MRRLILVRHAAPMKQPEVPAREWSLSPAGHADAARLAQLLAAYAPAAITHPRRGLSAGSAVMVVR